MFWGWTVNIGLLSTQVSVALMCFTMTWNGWFSSVQRDIQASHFLFLIPHFPGQETRLWVLLDKASHMTQRHANSQKNIQHSFFVCLFCFFAWCDCKTTCVKLKSMLFIENFFTIKVVSNNYKVMGLHPTKWQFPFLWCCSIQTMMTQCR